MGRWLDVSYPLGADIVSFIEDKGDYSVLETSIINILLTRRGELVGEPEFGSDFLLMVFEPADSQTEGELERICRDDVESQDDRVIMKNITFARPDPDMLWVKCEYVESRRNLEEVREFKFGTNSAGQLL